MDVTKLEENFGSFPSDILSPDDQDELFRNLQGDDVVAMDELFNDPISNMNNQDYLHEEDYKQDFGPPLGHTNNLEGFISIVPDILSNEEYPGPYDFDVGIHPNNGTKNPWVHSVLLNKIFMDMLNPFPVDFKISNRPPGPLFIRVTPQYSLPQHAQDCVYRCINHEHGKDNTNRDVEEHVRQHVIRCHNGNTSYIGDKNKNERLSVVIPFSFPQTGSESVREMFQFVCKSSCPNPGMNRRPIEVIFTLENNLGNILGRKCLNVRICSCPKRDKDKEEKEHREKCNNLPRGKKRKLERPEKKNASTENDTKEYQFGAKIVGKQNFLLVLKYMVDLMSGEVLRHPNELPYKKCLDELNTLRNKALE